MAEGRGFNPAEVEKKINSRGRGRGMGDMGDIPWESNEGLGEPSSSGRQESVLDKIRMDQVETRKGMRVLEKQIEDLRKVGGRKFLEAREELEQYREAVDQLQKLLRESREKQQKMFAFLHEKGFNDSVFSKYKSRIEEENEKIQGYGGEIARLMGIMKQKVESLGREVLKVRDLEEKKALLGEKFGGLSASAMKEIRMANKGSESSEMVGSDEEAELLDLAEGEKNPDLRNWLERQVKSITGARKKVLSSVKAKFGGLFEGVRERYKKLRQKGPKGLPLPNESDEGGKNTPQDFLTQLDTEAGDTQKKVPDTNSEIMKEGLRDALGRVKIKKESVEDRLKRAKSSRRDKISETEDLAKYVKELRSDIDNLKQQLEEKESKLAKWKFTAKGEPLGKSKYEALQKEIAETKKSLEIKKSQAERTDEELRALNSEIREYKGSDARKTEEAKPSVAVDPELIREGLRVKNEEEIRKLRRGLGLEEMDGKVAKTGAVVEDSAKKFARESKEEIEDPETAKKKAMDESYSKYERLKEKAERREYSGESPDMYVSFSAEKYKNTTDQMNTELARLDKIDEETAQLRESLGRVGFFNFSEKRRIKDEMKGLAQEKREIEIELARLDREILAMNSEITEKTGGKSFWDINIGEIGESHRKFQELSNEGGDSAENHLSFSYDQYRETKDAIETMRREIKSARGWTASGKRRQLSKKLDYFEGKLAKMDNEYNEKVTGSPRSTQRRLRGGENEKVAIVNR